MHELAPPVAYLNSRGYYFHNPDYYTFYNIRTLNCNNEQPLAIPSRPKRRRGARRSRRKAANKSTADANKSNSLLSVNMKNDLKEKIQDGNESNKGKLLLQPVEKRVESNVLNGHGSAKLVDKNVTTNQIKQVTFGGDCNRDLNCVSQEQPSLSCSQRRSRRRARKKAEKMKSEKSGDIEAINLQKGLGTKIQEDNKGFELLVKMGYENGKGLGKNGEGVQEPLMFERKTDRKGLGAADSTKSNLVTNQVKPHVSEKGDQVCKLNQQNLVNKKTVDPEKKSTQSANKQPENFKVFQQIAGQSTNQTVAGKTSALLDQRKYKFSAKDPCTTEFLLSIDRSFKSEIELMQQRLLEDACLTPEPAENDLIVAKIYFENNSNIGEDIFEFIRTELVGWIGAYQQEGMDTPIFHSMTKMNSYITIVCENKYAFECVERCIEDILQTKTMKILKIRPLPPITSLIYCVDAKYDGIASDSDLFLKQLHLHKPKLYSDSWVVVAHEVCPEELKTYFVFLIDERSALALNFQYSRRFCICMHQVTFRSRGLVRETFSK